MKFSPFKPGLSLIEVVLAILMIGISVITILSLQGTLTRGVFLSHAFIDRIAFIRSFFVEADRDKLFEDEKTHKKVIEVPQLSMTYKTIKPTGKGLKGYKNLIIEQVEAEWPSPFGTKKETFNIVRSFPTVEKKSTTAA